MIFFRIAIGDKIKQKTPPVPDGVRKYFGNLFFCAGIGGGRNRSGVGRCCAAGRCLGRDVIDQVLGVGIVGNGALGDEGWRNDTKYRNDGSEQPGAFFQHIGGLFHTHDLVTETAETGGEATPFRVLDQYDKTKYHRSNDH